MGQKTVGTIRRLAFVAASLALSVGSLLAQSFPYTNSSHVQFTTMKIGTNVVSTAGMPALPILYPQYISNGVVYLKWQGFPSPTGPFTVQVSTNDASGPWYTVSNTWKTSLVFPARGTAYESYRVAQPGMPEFAGSSACAACHKNVHTNEMMTAHATAFSRISGMPVAARKSCVPCHTVGANYSTGYKDDGSTPHLANVQCENCHGPAAAHAAFPTRLELVPKVDVAGEVCGGCHTGSHHPTYEEWSSTPHGGAFADFVSYVANTNAHSAANYASAVSRLNSCGWCHSGEFRALAMAGKNIASTPANVAPAKGTNSPVDVASQGITCVTCHDPHGSSYTAQLRNPQSSTNFFSLTTAYNGSVTLGSNWVTKYNPSVQTCAQCHNDRGMVWNSTGRPPHHSVQYPILIGNLGTNMIDGVTAFGNQNFLGTHAAMDDQCAGCHMQRSTNVFDIAGSLLNTGHKFSVMDTNGHVKSAKCIECHQSDAGWMDLVVEFSQDMIKEKMQEVQARLNLWAVTKASNALVAAQTAAGVKWTTNGVWVATTNALAADGKPFTTNLYLPLAWEFGTVGQLSTNNLPANVMRTSSGPVFAGPSAWIHTNAATAIPANIMQARTYLYLVEHDGSYGVHNPDFVKYLLTVADAKVKAELAK